MSAPCLYTVTRWVVVSCVCGMAFMHMCGSTLVKVPLLQAGIRAVRSGGAGGAAAPLHKFENLKGPHFCQGRKSGMTI